MQAESFSTIYSVAWAVGLVSWCGGVLEMFGMWRFFRPVYSIGIPIYSTTLPLPRPDVSPGTSTTLETKSGKFRFLGSTECLFRSKFGAPWKQSKATSNLKGMIVWGTRGASIRVRTMFFIPIFLLAFVTAWADVVMRGGHRGDSLPLMMLMAIIGLGIPAVMIAMMVRRDIQCARQLINELDEEIGSSHPPN